MSFVEIMQNLDVASPLFPNQMGRVLTINKNATLPEALKKMTDKKVMSLVIVDQCSGVACCAITITDIMHHLLNNFTAKEFEEYNIQGLFQKKEKLMTMKLTEIPEIAELDPAYSVLRTASMMDVINIMVSKGAHRVLVTNEDGSIVNLITQSRMVDIISCIMDSVQEAKTPISDFENLITRNVVTINDTERAYDAFQLMKEKRISAVGVVDAHGKLVGCISVDDIKTMGYDVQYFEMLATSVGQYIEAIRKSRATMPEYILDQSVERPRVIACQPSATLSHVIKLASFYDVHRLFVTDDKSCPIGVIALRDILRALTNPQLARK